MDRQSVTSQVDERPQVATRRKVVRRAAGGRTKRKRDMRPGVDTTPLPRAVGGNFDADRTQPRRTFTNMDSTASRVAVMQGAQPQRRAATSAPHRIIRVKASAMRAPAIWHRAAAGYAPSAAVSRPTRTRADAQHVEGRGAIRWRIVSGTIAAAMVGLLAYFFVSDDLYVHPEQFAIAGLTTMSRDEVIALTAARDMHLFWVDPAAVRANLLNSSTIADAEVTMGWSPNMIGVVVQERQPALIWEQGEETRWIDLQGRVMQRRSERTDLLRVVADADVSASERVSLDIVNAVLQLQQLRPDITTLLYTDANGLGYQDDRGWTAWFGVGTDMAEKILIYNAIVDNLQGRTITPRVINITNLDAPYYSSASR